MTEKVNYDEMSVEELIIYFRDHYDEVYMTSIGEEDYIWKTLSRKEYLEITEFAKDEFDANERVCQKAVLYPQINFSTTSLAYLPDQLAPFILDESGYGQYRKEKALLQIFRDQMMTFDNQAEVLVNRAFPYITFEELSTWTKEKLIKYVAKAEWSLQYIDQKSHIKLMTEEEARLEGDIDSSEEEEEEFDLMKVAGELRKKGEDPMFVLRGLYMKEKPPYFDRPLIGGKNQVDTIIAGLDAWREGASYDGRYEIIREQVQRVSRR